MDSAKQGYYTVSVYSGSDCDETESFELRIMDQCANLGLSIDCEETLFQTKPIITMSYVVNDDSTRLTWDRDIFM